MTNRKIMIISLSIIFFVLFLLNYLSDIILKLPNSSILKDFSVSLGVTLGVGLVWITISKKINNK